MFIINRQLNITKFGLIEFVPKGIYTSFFKIHGLELYYYYNNITKEEYIEVKGISNKSLENHENYFLQLLKDIFYSIQINGPEITLRMIKDVYMEYITFKLPIEYYRRFDISSKYHFKCRTNIGTGFEADSVTENMKPMLDITYNIMILIELQRIITSCYFNKHK